MSTTIATTAFLAGALVTISPCALPLLAAYVTLQVGSEEVRASAPSARLRRGLGSGSLISLGSLTAFALFGLPLSLGLTAVSSVIPWFGVVFGAGLVLAGLGALAGWQLSFAVPSVPRRPRTGQMAPVAFGFTYGTAALSCGLPLFLAVAGLATVDGLRSELAVFAAFAAGMSTVLVALAAATALARAAPLGRARRLSSLVRPLGGALMSVAGAYLLYYWLGVEFASDATLASDPLIGLVTDATAWAEARAQQGGATPLLAVTTALVVLVLWVLASQGRDRKAPAPRPGAAGRGETHPPAPGKTSPAVNRVTPNARAWGLLSVGLLLGVILGYGLSSLGKDDVASSPAWQPDLPARPASDAEHDALRAEGSPARISAESTDVDQLRALFNRDEGSVRIIALLSPTCVTCLRGAHWLQQQLETYPDASVRVYAVWFSVLPGDSRGSWDDRILTDPRVSHLWDAEQGVGEWFAQHGYGGGLPVQWDAVFLYEPQARWDRGDRPTGLVRWRRPIIAYQDELAEQLLALIG